MFITICTRKPPKFIFNKKQNIFVWQYKIYYFCPKLKILNMAINEATESRSSKLSENTNSILARLGRLISLELQKQDISVEILSRKSGLPNHTIEGILSGSNSTIEKVAVIEIALNVQFVEGAETLSLRERIGAKVVSKRDKATQLEISIISGVHKKALSVIENGRIPASGFSYGWGTVEKIEKALNFQLF